MFKDTCVKCCVTNEIFSDLTRHCLQPSSLKSSLVWQHIVEILQEKENIEFDFMNNREGKHIGRNRISDIVTRKQIKCLTRGPCSLK